MGDIGERFTERRNRRRIQAEDYFGSLFSRHRKPLTAPNQPDGPFRLKERESLKLLQPSEELAALIGNEPMSPAQAVEELWGYIRENGLQDAKNPRRIKADENFGRIFGGQDQVTLFELTRGVNRHLSPGSEGEVAATDEELGREFEEQVLASAYETLGCSPEMSDGELERKYRELSREYHPDRLAGEEIPAGIVKLAEERFQEIQSAYAVVVTSRS